MKTLKCLNTLFSLLLDEYQSVLLYKVLLTKGQVETFMVTYVDKCWTQGWLGSLLGALDTHR